MKLENEFKKWLKKCRYSAKTVGNKISNCRNVEKSYDDLDAHYEKDECKTIISELTYSADDARENRQSKHSILIKGNQRTGSATLKAAVRLYVAFRNDLKNGFSLENRQKISSNPNTKKEEKQKSTPKSLPHYEFPDNSKEVEETIAIALGKVCHFIQPQIVAKIREANIEFKEEFKAFCGNLDIDTFLFEDSDCVFPGVRRPIINALSFCV
ncbi:hypothetical protein EZS27_037035 [termite gut metagenome]|uniref:Uncharacterized protein n=1 Tax=termite gut metagenome TaxID=433724 RepID=A0A5J4PT99_9ZZZZ